MTILLQSTSVDGDPIPVGDLVNNALFVMLVIAGAFVVTRGVRALIKVGLTWLARRSRSGKPSAWLARIPRTASESSDVVKLRRDQRIRATSLMLSRMINVVLWLLAVFIILAGLDVDVVWALSSAGFLGAAVAIGGQHSVHDYLNGMHILLEDRFGEGDDIEVKTASGDTRVGTVERLGTFSTRLKSGAATWHISNRLLAEITNLSQIAQVIEVGISLANPVGSAQVEQAMRTSLGAVAGPGTGAPAVILDGLVAVPGDSDATHDYRVRVRTNASVKTSQHEQLAQDLADRLNR